MWLAKRFVEYVLILGLEFVIWMQYYQPQLDDLVEMIRSYQYSYIALLSKMLQMSIPTILMWIGGFYMIFQVHLNILAELTRFADRRFYDVNISLFRIGGTARLSTNIGDCGTCQSTGGVSDMSTIHSLRKDSAVRLPPSLCSSSQQSAMNI
jgi:hypothetical protein